MSMENVGIDWKEGLWRKHGCEAPCDQRIIVAGDWGPVGDYRDVVLAGGEALYGDLLPLLRSCDLGIVNVEGPLSESGTPIAKEGPVIRGEPGAIAALKVVPFHVACLANNHIMDYGIRALGDTQELLRAHAIETVGAGPSRSAALAPLVATIGGTRLGIVNFCEGEDATAATKGAGVFGWEIETVVNVVRELRPKVDVVIVVAHAGREHVPAPPPYLQKAFRTIGRSGADIVVGHHPHVPQGIEIFDGVPLVYSLGNFVFYGKGELLYRRLGYLLTIEVTGGRFTGFGLTPYVAEPTGLRCLGGPERAWFLERIHAVSSILEDPEQTRSVWNALIDSFGKTFWIKHCGGISWPVRSLLKEPFRAAAVLRNRFLTPAHRHFMVDGFSRLIAGRMGSSPSWATALVREWMSLASAPVNAGSLPEHVNGEDAATRHQR